jgi:MFS family permease
MATLTPPPPAPALALPWYRAVTPVQRRALTAASLGWMLDSMDVMLYSLVLAYLMKDLGMSKSTAGLLASVGQLSAAAGGVFFGVIADRFGRTRSLMASIAVYSVFTAACGFSHTILQLAIFRIMLGLGMGGVWASCVALVSETWPAEHRGKALGFMQSFWAVGYALAALVTLVVFPRWGWRAVFFIGALPALVILYIQRNVEEPAMWRERRQEPVATRAGLHTLFSKPLWRYTLALTLMNGGALFAYWGFNSWNPAFLSLPRTEGGVGLSAVTMSTFVIVMQVGTWLGYVSYGFISDRVGRKKTYVFYLLAAALVLPLYAMSRNPIALLALGPAVGFFGTGIFSGFGAVVAEIFPTTIRATALGFTYNMGRLASAIGPYTVGKLAETRGFAIGFYILAGAFVFSAIMWIFIPETRGRELA